MGSWPIYFKKKASFWVPFFFFNRLGEIFFGINGGDLMGEKKKRKKRNQ